ncbi:MAG: hypothetical protein M1434_09660 [Chloroflexi bacterium]|nr:hypothetical protein [Chloroflexota bacterium]MCL5274990.1 hypothetical protein [Chloroflexota bacterium]
MKLYAQHGAQEGEKINEGISRGLIDGVVFSPRDISADPLRKKIDLWAALHPQIDFFFDPQFYTCFIASSSDARLGKLSETEYGSYLQPRRRSQLERESQVRSDLDATLRFQTNLRLKGLIAPNILIPRSFDSIEAVIAKNFIRLTAEITSALQETRPVYATLAVSRDTLSDKQELQQFLNEITLLDTPPHGFYLLVSARSADARSDIYNADVIAAWMLINYSLRINGFDVINGYSDILTPFLGAAGGLAGCTGWWSNLRSFSTDRFGGAQSGGRLPIQRYLSVNLLNRIAFSELDQLRQLVPNVMNNLRTDDLYSSDEGSMPERNKEVLQSWEAIKALNQRLVKEDTLTSLQACLQCVEEAKNLYDIVQSQQIVLDPKSNSEHLDALIDGINLFLKLAEIDFATY